MLRQVRDCTQPASWNLLQENRQARCFLHPMCADTSPGSGRPPARSICRKGGMRGSSTARFHHLLICQLGVESRSRQGMSVTHTICGAASATVASRSAHNWDF